MTDQLQINAQGHVLRLAATAHACAAAQDERTKRGTR